MEVKARQVNGIHVCEAFRRAVVHVRVTEEQRRSNVTSHDGSLFFVKGMTEKVLGKCFTYCSLLEEKL
jgi:hypothetical protein